MCKICNVENMIENDGTTILDQSTEEDRFEFGQLGYVETELSLNGPEFEDDPSPKWELVAAAFYCDGGEHLQDSCTARIKIKYCPFCGRKLES